MIQLYYRDLRHRVALLEDHYLPEPRPKVFISWVDEDGLPSMVVGPGVSWFREDGEPVPPQYYRFGDLATYRRLRRAARGPAPPP